MRVFEGEEVNNLKAKNRPQKNQDKSKADAMLVVSVHAWPLKVAGAYYALLIHAPLESVTQEQTNDR